MSSPKIEIVNPIRFFSFFGLFLIFLFLAFRSCTEKQEGTKYVEADNLSAVQAANLKKANSEELSDFITDIKKDLKKSDQNKDLTAEQLADLEDINASKEKVAAALKKKKVEAKRRADAAKKKASVKKAQAAKKLASQASKNIIVKSKNGRLSPLSKAQLKQSVANSKNQSFSNIKIYGYYGMNQQKGAAFIKAAEIKNTLIGLGVKRSVPIYMLTEQTRLPNAMGKVIFSQ